MARQGAQGQDMGRARRVRDPKKARGAFPGLLQSLLGRLALPLAFPWMPWQSINPLLEPKGLTLSCRREVLETKGKLFRCFKK